MENNFTEIVNKSSLADNYKYYWGYQFNLGDEILVPYLSSLGVFKKGMKVAEIGSAEGGVLAAFTKAGADESLATDIAANRLEIGEQISNMIGTKIEYCYHNIMSEAVKEEWRGKFDLVILRDVIEHLDETDLALNNIRPLLKSGGYLFLTFPPYYSPFGGHQHTVANTLGKLPYIHLLPKALFHLMISSGRENDIGEVKRLENIKLTPQKLFKAAEQMGYSLFHEDYYLLRPVFKMKFGLPTLKISFLKGLPGIKNIFSLEASIVLQKKD